MDKKMDGNRMQRLKQSKLYQKYRGWAMLLLLCMIVQSAGIPGIFSYAGNNPFPYFTDVKMTEDKNDGKNLEDLNDIDPGESIRIVYTYDITNLTDGGINGQCYTFELPMAVTGYADFEIKGAVSGGSISDVKTIANVVFTNSTGTITFTEDAEEFKRVTFWFSAEWDQAGLGEGGEQTIHFPIEKDVDGGIDIVINTKPILISPDVILTKAAGTPNLTAGTIDWTITAKIGATLSGKPANATFKNIVIKDTLPPGLTFVSGSALATPSSVCVIDAAAMTFTLDEVKVTSTTGAETYTFTYQTEFDASTLKNGTNSFKNKAELNYQYYQSTANADAGDPAALISGKTGPAVGEAKVEIDFINKRSDYERLTVGLGGKIDWTVNINPGGLTIPGAKITDKIPAGLTLDETSIKLNKNSAASANVTTSGGVDAGTILTYDFKDTITTEQTLTYTTTITEEWYKEHNSAVKFENKVGLSGTSGNWITEKTATATASVGQSLITSCDNSKYNGIDQKSIDWIVVANANQVQMPIGSKIEFTIPEGLEAIIADAVTVTVGGIANTAIFGTPTVDGKKITLTTKTETSEKIVIGFTTDVEVKNYYTNKDHFFTLQGLALTLGTSGTPVSGTSCQIKVPSDMLNKDGKYSYTDKELTWTLHVNSNKIEVKNAEVKDILPDKLEYIKGSAAVGSTKLADDKVQVNDQTITFDLGTIQTNQVLTYKTRIAPEELAKNQALTFTNKASLSGKNGSAGEVTATAEKKVDVASTLIGKTGARIGNENRVKWTLTVNQNLQKIENAALEDYLMNLLSYEKDSLKIYDATVDVSTGKLTKGSEASLPDKKVVYDQNTNKLTVDFGETITTAYIVEFDTELVNVEGGAQVNITNSAAFKGMGGITTGGQTSNASISFKVAGGGGVGTTYLGKIQILKHRAGDEPKIPLSGAVFELWDQAGMNRIATSEPTTKDGITTFSNVRSGTYILKESKTPEGYLPGADSSFVVNFADKDQVVKKEVENKPMKGKFELTKVDGRTVSTVLEGAKIAVYTEGDVLVGEAVTDVSGKMHMDDLEYGTYYYVETEAPRGYVLDSAQYVFKISTDGITVEKTMKNDKGSTGGGGSSSGGDHHVPIAPETPTVPVEPMKPVDPSAPIDPTKPVDPSAPIDPINPIDPLNPTTSVASPTFTSSRIPNANDSTSPDQFILIDDDGVPLGTYEKHMKPDGTFEYISEDGVPLGYLEVPQTGDEMPLRLLFVIMVISLCGAGALILYRKRRIEK